jgi:hypothetical protein
MTTQKTLPFASTSSSNPFLLAFAPKNPFETASDEVPANAPEGSYTYQLVQNGPAVPAEECEVAVNAVQLMIRWGSTVMHVAELNPPRSFHVGEAEGKVKSDFFLPEEKLCARRVPVILAEGGAVRLVIPAGATGTVTIPGSPAKSVKDLVASGAAEPCAELAGAHTIALPTGTRVDMDAYGVSFEVTTGNAGKKPSRIALKGESLPYTGLSFLLHAGLLAATALFMPAMAMANEEGIPDDQKYALMQALAAEAQKEPEKQDEKAADTTKETSGGDVGAAAKGEMGKAGSTASRDSNKRFAIEKNGPEQALSRSEALQQAQTFGMIGLLQSLEGATNVPTVQWGRDFASGNDDRNAKGNIFGETIGDAAGSGGLNLTGIGEGGGFSGEGTGVGRVGTIGHDFINGMGHSIGRPHNGHVAKAPGTMRVSNPVISGRLPPEVIQRVVRQNFGRFRACYENGLRNNPSLGGRVAVRFVIGRDGDVSNVANGGSDLPDSGVVSCVTRAFYGLSFPHPENGIVTVTYPIVFTPSN